MNQVCRTATTALVFLAGLAVAESWTQFRGSAQSGVADSPLASQWSSETHLTWKVKVPGFAWSQPIIWNDQLFVTTAVSENQPKPTNQGGGGFFGRRGQRPPGEGNPPAEGAEPGPTDVTPAADGSRNPGGRRGYRPPPQDVYRWEVHCLDRKTGATLWTRQVAEKKPSISTHRTNTYASETPVTDGERLVALFGMTGLYCLSMDGNVLWEKDLGSYPMMNGWGTGSSPILVGDDVIVQCDNERESFLVAFDKKTGNQRWRVERDERSTWSTPYLWKNKLRTEIVAGGSRRVRSYDPATGKLFWELTNISGRSASTAVGDDEMVYFGTGGGMGVGPLVAMKAGAEGAVDLKDAGGEQSPIVWTSPRGGPPMASPLLYRGLLYVLDQRGGILTCYDAKTGDVVYKERLPGATGFTASPWAADGKVYCLDGDGTTFVVKEGRTFEVLSKNPLGEMTWASPALVDGSLYLRTLEHLYCIVP